MHRMITRNARALKIEQVFSTINLTNFDIIRDFRPHERIDSFLLVVAVNMVRGNFIYISTEVRPG